MSSREERISAEHAQNVEREIDDHARWCGRTCRTFLPESYREARSRHDKDSVQADYDSCHMWR